MFPDGHWHEDMKCLPTEHEETRPHVMRPKRRLRPLIHVLPTGLHRIRHYGLLAKGNRAANIARARELLAVPSPSKEPQPSEANATDQARMLPYPCPCCGGRMIIIESFARGCQPTYRGPSASQ